MIHSKEFLEVISFESLYKAHMRARLGKRGKREVIEFEMNLSENLWDLHYDLLYGRYEMSEYRKFMIHDPKAREIQAISYRDRVIQHSICDNYLVPLLEKRLIFYNVACRKNKGTGLAISALKKFMTSHYKKCGLGGYIIKIDIKKYFDSIDHELLKDKIRLLGIPCDMIGLLNCIIDSYSCEDGKGIPMGNQSSQCFALLYLDCIDRVIKEVLRIKYYVRYMDDMILIVSKKEEARYALDTIKKEVEKQLLVLNEKSQAIAFKNGVVFLGRRFFIDGKGKIIQKLTKSSRQRIMKKVKKKVFIAENTRQNKKSLMNSFVSYRGLLEKTNSWLFLNKLKKEYE